MKEKKILVLGGKGKTGRKVAERLSRRGIIVRIGSRNEAPPFDWEKPETWAGALEGMNAVYITYQPDLAIPGAPEAIKGFTAEAVKSGIQKMVMLSGRGEKPAKDCEEIVKHAGPAWTIVRGSWFNQNFSENFLLEPVLSGEVVIPQTEAPEPFVDTDDIADVVVASLLDDQHNSQTYDLTGPQLMTFDQAVAEIAKATGREIRFQSVPLEAYKQVLRENQVPEGYIWLINYLFSEVLDGRNANMTGDIEKVLGRKATTFSEYATKTAKTGIWDPTRQPVHQP